MAALAVTLAMILAFVILRAWLERLSGYLKHGRCPLCRSSPPRVQCPVCEGLPPGRYGPGISDDDSRMLRTNWRDWHERRVPDGWRWN